VPDDGTKYRLRTSTGAGTRTTDALPQDDASAHRIDVATTVGDITARAGAA